MANSRERYWVCLPLVLLATPAAAHGDGALTANVWLAWSFGLDFILPLVLVCFVYLRGVWQRQQRGRPTSHREASLVFLGLFMLFLALQSPIDPLGERSFSMHQVQHLLLRALGPMLLFLPSPQTTFVAGLNTHARRFLARVGRLTGLSTLSHPVTVTLLFAGLAYVWQYPPYFELALRNDMVHYLMHVTMLGSGLLFWWCIFDTRPSATHYGTRLAMLWIATTANIALGAYLTMKSSVLYPVYDELGRLWVDGEMDELLGGLIVWILGSMMSLVPFLVILRRWGYKKDRIGKKRMTPTSAGGGAVGNEPRDAAENTRRLGWMLGLFSGGVFLALISVMSLSLAVRG
ncbi:cytochrome c oxidase assembly protein [Litchfieldella rifensis]|uniref:Cytochrome c oxidase assembly protein n=1 Tax=Litchfieldella rifensis TaxID=762643 RepID=A0ABV7LS52_9GAMM